MIAKPGTRRQLGRQPAQSAFVYKPAKPEDIQKRAERQGGNFDSIFKQGFDTFTPVEGDNLIRILPGTWEGHDHFGMTAFVHQYIGPDTQSYLCLRKMLNKPCPVCEGQEEAKRERDDELAKQLSPSERVLYWILNRDARDYAAYTPILYNVSWTADKDITGLCRDSRTTKILYVDHPDEGYDLSFRRVGKQLKTRYSQWAFARDRSPIAEDPNIQDEILTYIVDNPLDSILQYFTYDHIAKSLNGAETEEQETTERAHRGRGRDSAPDEEELATEDQYEEQPAAEEYAEEGEEPAEGEYAEEEPWAADTEEAVDPDEEWPEETSEEEYVEPEPEPPRRPAPKPMTRATVPTARARVLQEEPVPQVRRPPSPARAAIPTKPAPAPTRPAPARPAAAPVAARPAARPATRPASAAPTRPVARPTQPPRR